MVSKPAVRERQRLELGLHAHPVLGGPRAVEVGQVGLLRDRQERGRRVGHGGVAAQPLAPLGQQGDLVGHRHGRRVDLERARPGHVAVRRLGRQLDPPPPALLVTRAISRPGGRGRPPPPAGRRPRRRNPRRRRPRRARPCRSPCRPPSSRDGRRGGGPSGCGCARPGAPPPGSPRPRRARRRPGRRGRRWQRHQAAGVGWRSGSPAAA